MACPNTSYTARQRYEDYLAVHRQVTLSFQIDDEPLTFREWRRSEREAIETIIPSQEYADAFQESVVTDDEIDQLMRQYARGVI